LSAKRSVTIPTHLGKPDKLIFQVLEMSLNFTKSGNIPGKIIACEKIHLEQKKNL